jgi:hypothetical protein
MAINPARERERAGMTRDAADGGAGAATPAERGQPEAEHGQYGMVREHSEEARGLTERQIRGVDPRP